MSITEPSQLAALLAELSGVLVGFGLLFGVLMGVGFYGVKGLLTLVRDLGHWVHRRFESRRASA